MKRLVAALVLVCGLAIARSQTSDRTDLWRAAGRFNLPELRAHLEGKRGYNPTVQERTDLLSFASLSQHEKDIAKWKETVDLLVSHGARLDEHGKTFSTPLVTASEKWSDQFVHYLLLKGSDPNAGWPGRETRQNPLQAALVSQEADQLLPRFKRGESYETGETAAQVLGRFRRTVALLLDAGADPMRPGYQGKVPFQKACYWGEAEMVRHMIRKGAKPNAEGPPGPTVYGACGYTALHCAVLRDSPENARTVRLLLASWADRNAKDDLGRTPLQLARQKGHVLVAKALGG